MESEITSDVCILDGVAEHEVNADYTNTGEQIVRICIDDATHKLLKEFFVHSYYVGRIADRAKYYITTQSLLDRRKALIRDCHLSEHELLILILLSIAPWVEDDRFKQRIKKKFEDVNPDFENFMSALAIFDRIRLNRANGLPDDYNMKWEFDSFKIIFNNKSNVSKKLRIPETGHINHNPYFLHLVCDYLTLVEASGGDYRTRMENAPGHTATDWESIEFFDNPHYLFCYKFINFLESEIPEYREVKDERYRQYIKLLEEAGYTVGSETGYNEEDNVRNWYNLGKKSTSTT